jgi:scyllo-inositol 2-dehydrogenase (NADP+)
MKILTIGTSIITSRFIDAVVKSNESKVTAIYSRDMSKAIALAYPLGALAFDDLDKALQCIEVDTVYVASVNHMHAKHAIQALNARKHVILEKPVTSNEAEFESILECAKQNGVFVFEAITTLHLPNYHWIKENLNKIGSIKHVYASYHQYSSKYGAYLNYENPNVFNLKTSGGCLVDLNVYNLHFILSLWPSPMIGSYTPNVGHNGVDLSGAVIFKYEDFIAVASASKVHEGGQRIIIEGEKGFIECQYAANKLTQCVLKTSDEEVFSPLDHENNALVYEIKEFEVLISQNQTEKIYELNMKSLNVIRWMTKVRKEANLWFEGE